MNSEQLTTESHKITIGKNFDDLRIVTQTIADENGVSRHAQHIINNITRSVDQLEIIECAMDHYRRTGKKLPNDLKEKLCKDYCYSEKQIERLVYDNIQSDSSELLQTA